MVIFQNSNLIAVVIIHAMTLCLALIKQFPLMVSGEGSSIKPQLAFHILLIYNLALLKILY